MSSEETGRPDRSAARRVATFSAEGPIHTATHHNVARMRQYVTLSLDYGKKPFLVDPAQADGITLHPYPEVKQVMPAAATTRHYLLASKLGVSSQELVYRFIAGLKRIDVPVENWAAHYGVRFYAHADRSNPGLIAYVYKQRKDAEGPEHALLSLHPESDDALMAFQSYLHQVSGQRIPFSLAHHARGRATTSRVQRRRQTLEQAKQTMGLLLGLLREYHQRTREDPAFADLAEKARPHLEKEPEK